MENNPSTEKPIERKEKQEKKIKKGPKNKGRDKQRSEQFRERVGNKVQDSVIADAINKTLFAGFEHLQLEFEFARSAIRECPKILTTSTRGIGFTLQTLFKQFNDVTTNAPECTVYDAYRVSLAQTELKLLEAQTQQVETPPEYERDLYYDPSLSLQHRDAIRSVSKNFAVIENVIGATGNFEYEGQKYYARMPKPGGPLSTAILFSNLRSTVVALADRRTDLQIRQRFYESSPLPGAIWGGHPDRMEDDDEIDHVLPQRRGGRRRRRGALIGGDFPLLMNPDDFMPPEYTIDEFKEDIFIFKDLLTWLEKKNLPGFVGTGSIIYDGKGQRSQLVSSRVSNLRIESSTLIDARIDWKLSPFPSGKTDEFWAPVKIDLAAAVMGAMQLMGEIPQNTAGDPFSIREPGNAAETINLDWFNLVGRTK